MDNKTEKPNILFIGPMLGGHPGWVPNPSELIGPRLGERGYRWQLTSPVINRYLRLLDTILTLLRKGRSFDIFCIMIYSGPAFIICDIASLVAAQYHKPIVMVLHGGRLPVFFGRHPNWARRVLGRAARLVTPSLFLAHNLEPFGFEVEVIPNGLDLQGYPFRERSQIKPNLLWMRTFHTDYNPKMAIDVLAKLLHRFPEANLTMAGQEKGELEPTQHYAREVGVFDRIRFAGFLDPSLKISEFSQHDIFLNTNHVDNMPVSVIEAAAFGLPIISTAVGGIPFMLRHGDTGLLVPDGDHTAMANEVERLLNDPQLTKRLSSLGRKWAEEADWSVVIPLWERLIKELCWEPGNS